MKGTKTNRVEYVVRDLYWMCGHDEKKKKGSKQDVAGQVRTRHLCGAENPG